MVSNHINLEEYLQKHLNNTLSEQEKVQLAEFLNDPGNGEQFNRLVEEWYSKQPITENFTYDKGKVDKMIKTILKDSALFTPVLCRENEEIPDSAEDNASFLSGNRYSSKKIFYKNWIRYAAAAILVAGTWYFYNHLPFQKEVKGSPVAQQTSATNEDLPPGSQKAVLTLSNGKQIELDEKGQQVINDGAIAIQNNDGSLMYGKSDVVAYNTMATPRGGQYNVKLPDGTLVWLNAASSITYPTAFSGKTREVKITGEAYFEVTKNPVKPFVIKTYKDEITVTGTSFNVNSYPDEPGIKTSLLEGIVQVNGSILKPGNAYINGKITPADLAKDLAWKNGVFNFHHVKMAEAMRQIARWYDIDVHYENDTSEIELGGEIGRNLTLKQLLNGLQDKDIHFRLKGMELTVY
ncbi:MAG: FecR family protein [Agriterribacter sp.]